ncbi:MAG: hypothetical protein NT151_10010 [Acidobacteria bacterium]|nr:hypothetical protein [Acidobacteriota bacterium]
MNVDVFGIAIERLRALDQGVDFHATRSRSTIGAELLARAFGPPAPPSPGESLAIALVRPKTAALAFDRIWGLDVNLPPSIRFGGLAYGEYDIVISAVANCWDRIVRRCEQGLPWDDSMDDHVQLAEGLLHDQNLSCPLELFGPLDQHRRARARLPHSDDSATLRTGGLAAELQDRWVLDLQRLITTAIGMTLGQIVGQDIVTVHDSTHARDAGCLKSAEPALLGILDGLRIVDERRLSWEMVEEFRADPEARRKYKRLLHWLRTSMASKSQREVEDEVGCRLEEYEWALKKHGIETLLGHIESVLDPRFLAPTVGLGGIVGLFGEPLWGALSAGAVLLGRASLKVASYFLTREDIARRTNPEVSYVYQAKKLVRGKASI